MHERCEVHKLHAASSGGPAAQPVTCIQVFLAVARVARCIYGNTHPVSLSSYLGSFLYPKCLEYFSRHTFFPHIKSFENKRLRFLEVLKFAVGLLEYQLHEIMTSLLLKGAGNLVIHYAIKFRLIKTKGLDRIQGNVKDGPQQLRSLELF
jgi:hypothetical protein